MYYKITNKNSEVYKKLYELRSGEIEMSIYNIADELNMSPIELINNIVDDNKRIIPHVPVAERSYMQEGTDVVVELSKESQLALCWDLRRLTGEGLMTCKEALKENNWDIKQAKEHLITHSKYIRW